MQLELCWEPRVPKGLRTLSYPERRRVVATILSLLDDPEPPGVRPLPGKPTWFRLQDGPFGLVYALDLQSATLTIYIVTKNREPLGAEDDE